MSSPLAPARGALASGGFDAALEALPLAVDGGDERVELAGVLDRDVGVAEALGKTPSQVALAWVVQQPGVTSPIFGARTLEQLEDNVGASDVVFDDEARKRLEEVSALELEYPYDFHERVRGITAGMMSGA